MFERGGGGSRFGFELGPQRLGDSTSRRADEGSLVFGTVPNNNFYIIRWLDVVEIKFTFSSGFTQFTEIGRGEFKFSMRS